MKINILNCRASREMVTEASPPDFYIGRPSPLGNPFQIYIKGRRWAIREYKRWLHKNWRIKIQVNIKKYKK